MTLPEPELDVVIPVYNEGKNIVAALDSLKRAVKTPFRVLICYDHDEDDTLAALDAYRPETFAIVRVKNRGKGAFGAIMTGFAESRAPAVLMFPADDDFNAPIVDRLMERFREGCDIVAPSRFMPGGCMVGCPWFKAVLVRTAAFFLYHVARLPTHDPTNGFRLFSRRLLDAVPIESTEGFTYSLELLVKCHRLGWKIAEVPASWYERKAGRSRFNVLSWVPEYMVWVLYAFATTFALRGPRTVAVRERKERPAPAKAPG